MFLRIVTRPDRRETSIATSTRCLPEEYLLPLVTYKARYARSLELYDVMRSRVLAWSRFGVHRVECAAQQRLIKYEISFTRCKALTEASNSILAN